MGVEKSKQYGWVSCIVGGHVPIAVVKQSFTQRIKLELSATASIKITPEKEGRYFALFLFDIDGSIYRIWLQQ